MDAAKAYFEAIAKQYVIKKPAVSLGTTSSGPGLLYRDEPFASYREGYMAFRLAENFDPYTWRIRRFDWLASAPHPMSRASTEHWLLIPYEEKSHWAPLTEAALDYVQHGNDGFTAG